MKDLRGNTADTPVPEWFLAPHEETEIRKRCHDQANEKCYREFVLFGHCAEKHQILFSWKCADFKKQLLDCVAHWGSSSVYEQMREEYINEKKAALRKESS